MKTIIYVLLLLASTPVFAQEKLMEIIPIKDGQPTYEGIIDCPGITRDQIFERAKRWIATTYKSANDVIQLSDKEAGSLIAKGTMSAVWHYNGLVNWDGYVGHTLTIDIKDEKYRYRIDDLRVIYFQPISAYGGGKREMSLERFTERPMQKKNSRKFCEMIDEKFTSTIAELQKSVLTNLKDF